MCVRVCVFVYGNVVNMPACVHAASFSGDSLLWDPLTRQIIDLSRFPAPKKFLPEFMTSGPDGQCGNYDCSTTHWVTVVGDQRASLAVYVMSTPAASADGSAEPGRRFCMHID